jgi:quinol monooxygenase YgiN
MSERITIIVPIKAKEEHKATVRQRLVELAALTNREEGNINYIIHEVPDDPCRFMIYENWKDQVALDFHMEQDYLKKFLEDGKELFAEEVCGTICKVIE